MAFTKNYTKYKSQMILKKPEVYQGWGIYELNVDNRFNLYLAATHEWIKPAVYPFDDLCELVGEMPIFAFPDKVKAYEFAKTKSNRHTIDVQMKALRWHPEYWLSTLLINYLDFMKYLQEYKPMIV